MTKSAAVEAVRDALEKSAGAKSRSSAPGAASSSAGPAIDAEQLALLPSRPSLTASEKTRVDVAVRADRRGRPPGARNHATRDALDFVRKVIGDPLIDSARWCMHTPESLAIELGCSKAEAFDRLEKIRADLRPYFYAKQAPVDGDGNAVVPGLTMVIGGQNARLEGTNGQPLPPWLYEGGPVVEHEQNQALSAQQPPQSHGDVSHGDEK